MSDNERFYISRASDALDRQVGTLRKWDREDILPPELRPERDDQNRRYWTKTQIDAILAWLRDTDRRPGRGLLHYKPNDEQIARHLARQRGPRSVVKSNGAMSSNENGE